MIEKELREKYPEIPVGKAKNLIGNKYNKITILYRAKYKNDRPYWAFKCDCGEFGIRRGSELNEKSACQKCSSIHRRKDLSGQKFNKLTVTSENESRNGVLYWKCICDCGNETWVRSGNLKSNEVKSCGCLSSLAIRKYGENFIGTKFGKLTVIKKTEERKHQLILWECKCDCGNTCLRTTVQLENESYNGTCGCEKKIYHHLLTPLEDLTGKVFYDLTVIDFVGSKNGSRYWACKCKCGNIKDVSTRDLTRGAVKSCGCRKFLQIKPGDKFGRLTVVTKSNKLGSNGCFLWECDCDCGTKKHIVSGSYLISGTVKSCGCGRNISYGEENIATLLNNDNLFFTREYNIKELNKKHPTHGRPREFDFYVNNQYIIEYDGSQHFKYTDTGWNTKEHFERTRKSDLIKNKYCFDNNIPLIRIPYDAKYTIDDLKLETTRFLLTPENEEEYYESRK